LRIEEVGMERLSAHLSADSAASYRQPHVIRFRSYRGLLCEAGQQNRTKPPNESHSGPLVPSSTRHSYCCDDLGTHVPAAALGSGSRALR
jgi:hypothetical protein